MVAEDGRLTDALKRVGDFASSILGLVALAPVFGLIAMAIRLDSPGPVFFRQVRVGRKGAPFTLLKFRTMRWGTPDLATDVLQASGIDPRTRVGTFLRRFSLDELPQLVNVLRGEMSLVGPRPALPSQTSLNEQRAARGIDRLLPGITGWAQINGRDEIPEADKVALDGYYERYRSLWFDLRILVCTFLPVLSGRGNH